MLTPFIDRHLIPSEDINLHLVYDSVDETDLAWFFKAKEVLTDTQVLSNSLLILERRMSELDGDPEDRLLTVLTEEEQKDEPQCTYRTHEYSFDHRW